MIFNPIIGGGGGSTPALGSKTITANGTYLASSDNLDGYDEVTANVPNTYTAGDEGKVVSNGALVAQSSENITQNGTYDTTLKNQVVVNVSGSSPNLQAKTGLSITSNGSFSYTPDAGYDGLSEVSGTVNVSGGGGAVSPDYQGFSYGFLSSGTFYSYPSQSCYINFFSVQANHKYILFAKSDGGNRKRAAFFSGKTYADFEQYVTTGSAQASKYSGTNIVNNDSAASANEPISFKPSSNGMLVYQTNNTSGAFPAVCLDQAEV